LAPGATFDPSVLTAVATGKYAFGKHAWTSDVQISLKGGGPIGDLGCDQVVVQVVQNVVWDNVIGEYGTKIAKSVLAERFRTLDTGEGVPRGYDGPDVGSPARQCPFLFTPGIFQIAKNDPTARILRVGDSPGVGFKTKEGGEPLNQIRGLARFRDAVVSFSKHAKNSIVAHAVAEWDVDFTGNVAVSNGIGQWSRTSANVANVQGWQPTTPATGTDVSQALLEIFPPRAAEFNDPTKKIVEPKK
jgi:hypothetical protein